jgi:hypothetical protein
MADAGRIRFWWWSIASCLHTAYDDCATNPLGLYQIPSTC